MPPRPDSVKPFQAKGVVVFRALGTPVLLWLAGDTFPDGVHSDWIVQIEPTSAWCQLLVSPGLRVGIQLPLRVIIDPGELQTLQGGLKGKVLGFSRPGM